MFVGFTLSQAGMVRHWREQHAPGWARRAVINGVGAVFTAAALLIELVSKFTTGAWLIMLVVPLLFRRVHASYARIGALLGLGSKPPPPRRLSSLVVVPVGNVSRLTAEAISTALSLGDEVTAVTVCYCDPDHEAEDSRFQGQWNEWHP